MEGKKFIFIAGLHRSGTSLLHEIIRSHAEISGFHNTGAPEDEGQHLQTVYEPASSFGGPGKFAFDGGSRMDESHPLATSANAKKIFEQWRPHFDMSCNHLVEKSPPNIIRTRFLQKLFPESKFIFILRHPLAVSYATMKWSGTSIYSLLEHYLLAHEIMMQDLQHLHFVHILRYEALIEDLQKEMDSICSFLELSQAKVNHETRKGVNESYFRSWESDRRSMTNHKLEDMLQKFEVNMNRLGYSVNNYCNEIPVSWMSTANISNRGQPFT